MDEPQLQTTLREKYNISDRLLAEGRFVGLIGDHAASLVCLGLGVRCLVVAKVVLSGDVIDYDLISITPLPLLSLSYQNIAKKIKIRSQFKPTQVFQLCTSANQAEVWDNFTSTIKEVYMPEQGDTWCSTTLHSPETTQSSPSSSLTGFEQASSVSCPQNFRKRTLTVSRNSLSSRSNTTSVTDFEQQSLSQSSYFSQQSSTISYRSISSLPKFDSRLSESSVSLPAKLPSQTDTNNNWRKSSRCNSVDLLDVKFERFVNDAPTVCNEHKDQYITYTWTGCAEHLMTESDHKLNVSNNFIEDMGSSIINIPVEEVVNEKSDSRVRRFFKRAWFCCTGKKTGDN